MSRIVTILAITGAQQNAIAAQFAADGWAVRGTSRKPGTSEHGEIVAANLETGEGLSEAMAGAEVVVLTLPQDHRSGVMADIARRVADSAARARVGRLILNTAGTIDEAGDGPLFQDIRAARDAVQSGDVPWVVLQPTVFMDNLRQPWSLPAIVNDHVLPYPAPEHARISWLSHRSLADFVHAAATRGEAIGRDLRVGGPAALSGTELCAVLAQKIGQPITYQQIPLQGFAAGLNQAFGAPAGDRIASLYARLEPEPGVMAVGDATAMLLGVAPESFASFVDRYQWQPA